MNSQDVHPSGSTHSEGRAQPARLLPAWLTFGLGVILLAAVALSNTVLSASFLVLGMVFSVCVVASTCSPRARPAVAIVRRAFSWNKPRRRMLLFGAGAGLLIWSVTSELSRQLKPAPEPVSQDRADVLLGQSGTAVDLISLLMFVLVLAPLFEETLYRGLAWNLLVRVPRAITVGVAILLTSIAFGLSHPYSLTSNLIVVVSGLGYCLVRVVTGEVWSSFVGHSVYNGLTAASIMWW